MLNRLHSRNHKCTFCVCMFINIFASHVLSPRQNVDRVEVRVTDLQLSHRHDVSGRLWKCKGSVFMRRRAGERSSKQSQPSRKGRPLPERTYRRRRRRLASRSVELSLFNETKKPLHLPVRTRRETDRNPINLYTVSVLSGAIARKVQCHLM